ncbi:MAG TPA: 50S ribosomal protein L30 [Polyangia bacterium]|jgi:large subunit ribosomal protein L30
MALKLKVTLVRSGINRPEKQRLTMRGLGLTRLHKTVVLNDTPAVRGMIKSIVHLVHVEPAD